MDKKERIFLTHKEALKAIRIDFEQYGAQPRLFEELCEPILGNRALVQAEGAHAGVWIKLRNRNKMRRISEDELGERLFKELSNSTFSLPVLADICSKVFQAPAWPGKNNENDYRGIWVETGITSLNCQQCGSCCINLKYHNDCTEKDYKRRIALGRFDILERVKLVQYSNKTIGYRIWFNPENSRLFSKCPCSMFEGTMIKY